jgi:hypothetical protein
MYYIMWEENYPLHFALAARPERRNLQGISYSQVPVNFPLHPKFKDLGEPLEIGTWGALFIVELSAYEAAGFAQKFALEAIQPKCPQLAGKGNLTKDFSRWIGRFREAVGDSKAQIYKEPLAHPAAAGPGAAATPQTPTPAARDPLFDFAARARFLLEQLDIRVGGLKPDVDSELATRSESVRIGRDALERVGELRELLRQDAPRRTESRVESRRGLVG